MKFLRIFISILLLSAGLNYSLTAQPQYYDYTGAGSGSNSFPFNVTGGKDVQILYLAGEFNQPSPAPAGNITSVSFYMTSALAATFTNLTINLGQSNITTLTSGQFYSGPMTLVYSHASAALSCAANSWMTITLDSPFPYDPTLSLIVDVGQCAESGTGATCAFTNLSGVRRVWSVGGCPFTPYASSSIYVYNFGFNLQTSGPPIVTTGGATGITASGATLNGTVNANGSLTTVTFEYGLNTGYGNTVSGVPGTVSGNTGTAVSAAISGLQPGTLYHFRAKGVNSNGTTNGNDNTFTTLALAPTAVTNPATNVTLSSAQLNGTVTANGGSSTVTFDWGLTTGYGSSIAAIPGTVTGNSSTNVMANLTGLTSMTTYHYRVHAVNSIGTTLGLDQSFYTCVSPSPAGTLSGPSNVCMMGTGYVYSVPPIPNAVNYIWTVPSGWVIVGGSNTPAILVNIALGASSGTVSVYGSSICGSGAPSSLNVTVNPLPTPTISGPASSCVGAAATYSTQMGNVNYVWSVTSGGTITSGLGSDAVVVTWNTTGAQTVTVNYTSPVGCTAPNPASYAVTVNSSPSPTITGPTEMCVNSGYYYYSTQVGFSNYQWTVSPGGSIVYGQGTNQAQVSWNAPGSQWVAVNYSNANGCSAPSPTSYGVTVDDVPGPAGTISGTSSVCPNAMGVEYSVAPVSGALSYVWSLPAGATIATGSGTNDITVDYGSGAISGNITVLGNNLCGNGASSPPFGVTVNPVPPAPYIEQVDLFVVSDAPAGNQWYGDNVLLAGETGQTVNIFAVGHNDWLCYDIVTLNGCSSDTSNFVYVINEGVNDQHPGNTVNIYPNPADGKFTVSINSPSRETYSIQVYNNLGVMVAGLTGIEVTGNVNQVIDLGSAANGIYSVMIGNGHDRILKKVVIDK